MRSIFDQQVSAMRVGANSGSVVVALSGAIAAANPSVVLSYASAGVTVAFMIYTRSDPFVAAGDTLIVGGVHYPVVSMTRAYTNRGVGAGIYVTPCGQPA